MKDTVRFLGSARLALTLIFILTGFLVPLSIGGIKLFEAPFISIVFGLLLACLVINTGFCTWQRAKAMLRASQRKAQEQDAACSDVHPLLEEAAVLLQSRGYQIRSRAAGTFTASKHLWAGWGPVVSHAGLIVVLLGFALSVGLRMEAHFKVVEGQVFESPGMDYSEIEPAPWSGGLPEFAVFLQRLNVSTYDGPALISGDLVFLRNGKEVKKETVETGIPVKYGLLAFHQVMFGYTTGIVIKDVNSGAVYPVRLNLETLLFDDGESYEGTFALPNSTYLFDVQFFPSVGGTEEEPELLSYRPDNPAILLTVYPDKEKNSQDAVFRGVVRLGDNLAEGFLDIRFDHFLRWSGLKVVKDPGLPILLLGGLLVTVGMLLTYLVIPKKVSVFFDNQDKLRADWQTPRFAAIVDPGTRLALKKAGIVEGEDGGRDAL